MGWKIFFDWNMLHLLIGICLTTVVHELIHGIAWSAFCENGFKSIKFGFNKGMPYCHCESPLRKNRYIVGAIAPLVVLGGILFIASLFFQSDLLFLLTQINILSAGGDLLIIVKAAKVEKNAYLIDHPNLPGFVSFENY